MDNGLAKKGPENGLDCEEYFVSNFHSVESEYYFKHICAWEVYPSKDDYLEVLDLEYINSLKQELSIFLSNFDSITNKYEPPDFDSDLESFSIEFGYFGLHNFALHLYWLCGYCQQYQLKLLISN